MTVAEVLAIGEGRTNADLIYDAGQLGYIEGRVLDLTYVSQTGGARRARTSHGSLKPVWVRR